MPAIDVQGLTYTYPGCSSPALKQITVQVNAGQLVAVIGANGAGKSSLCLALAGLIPALFHGQMQGTVTIANLDTRIHSAGDFAGRVGLVLQNPVNQLSGMRYTVYEEVAFGLENLGVAREEMPGRIEHALQLVGLLSMRDRSPFTLSGGQQQRLALASVLVLQPPVLVLDEPTAMLDPQGSREIFEIVRNFARSGAAVVIAEQNLEWIAASADHVIVLAKGEVILAGAPQMVLADPQLTQTGVGRLRYTRAAELGLQRGVWPVDRPLAVTLDQAVAGFKSAGSTPIPQEQDHENPG